MDKDILCIDQLCVLVADMIENANSGHPGMPLGTAPLMYVLWTRIINHYSDYPDYYNRDRFVLSNGHGCAILYALLFFMGYDYTLNDLKKFRQIYSKTPGHPEKNIKLGIEVTTGPLGQGFANAVGMAISAKRLNIQHYIYCVCGDGCIMEGITYESASLAGHLKLDNLIILYDCNNMTIDGELNLSFSEDVKKRFESMNWTVYTVDGNKIVDIENTINKSKLESTPVIIITITTIGNGTNKAGLSLVHGTPLGKESITLLKQKTKFDVNKTFEINQDVLKHFKKFQKKYNSDTSDHNICSVLNDNILNAVNDLKNINLNLKDKPSRVYSGKIIEFLIDKFPNFLVGSADVALSTNVINKNMDRFIHFGIREHAMGGIANGISTYNIIPIISTYLSFVLYQIAALRLAALSRHKVIYILTHDSINLGEDGPTHQPIEQLSMLRSIPNLLVFRPCTIEETIGAYSNAILFNGPSCICLSREPIINISNTSIHHVNYGAYTLYCPDKYYNTILISSGADLATCWQIIEKFRSIDIHIKLVSVVSQELFETQDIQYKNYILEKDKIIISIESGISSMWYKYANYCIGIDNFGYSGKLDDVKHACDFSLDHIMLKLSNIFLENKIINTLQAISLHTLIVADTADINLINKYKTKDVTTNPSLLLKYINENQEQLKNTDKDTSNDLFILNLYVKLGADILRNIEGRISIEVNPNLSFDTEETINQAIIIINKFEELGFSRDRVLIKIAATWEGIQAAKILELDNIHCNMTLIFSLTQAIECGNNNITLISPFVGRILDWNIKNCNYIFNKTEKDPGVLSVTNIYNYFKQHNIKTTVMSASFRNIYEILYLIGCDALTISPILLEELTDMHYNIDLELNNFKSKNQEKYYEYIHYTEVQFKTEINNNEMCKEKLEEGINKFIDDYNALKRIISSIS